MPSSRIGCHFPCEIRLNLSAFRIEIAIQFATPYLSVTFNKSWLSWSRTMSTMAPGPSGRLGLDHEPRADRERLPSTGGRRLVTRVTSLLDMGGAPRSELVLERELHDSPI